MEDFEQGAMSNDGQHACVVVAVNALQFKTNDELECWEQVGLCSYGEIVTQPCELTAKREMDCCCLTADADALLTLANLARV